MLNETDINNQDAISQMNEENLETSSNDMTSEEALSLMRGENTASEENPERYDVLDKKEEYRILTIIEKTELLMGDFFKKLAAVDSRFNNVAQAFINNAVKIGESKKELTKEEQNLVMINVAAAVAVKGIGALWQSIQTELQLRGTIRVFAQEAEEKMPYIGMLIDWLDTADAIAFERLLDSTDFDVLDINLELYRGLNYSFRLANFLYSVYDASLKGEFTKIPYPTMFDVNQALINNLAHIESKETEAGQLEANRAALSTVAKRIRSVMTGETELPNLIDVMIASDGQLMATAINMGLPAPDSFEDAEEELGETRHFPFEELTMIPESIDYVSEFSSLKGCGNSHEIAQKINNNASIDNVRTYIDEFRKNQKNYNSRLTLYGINSWLLAGVTFLLFWQVWDWAWYWSLLMGIVLLIFNAKCSPISNITRISRNKAILLERDLIKFSKSKGGYTEVIDFRQLRRKNNTVFKGAIIGGIIGVFVGPGGFIAGILIGSFIGWFVKSYKPEKVDWRNVSIGSGIWAKIWCAILSLTLLYLIYFAFFKSPSAGSLHNPDADVITTEFASPVEETAQVAVTPSANDFSEDGKTVLYSDQRYKWYYNSDTPGFPKDICVYDSESSSTEIISINKTRTDSKDVEIRGIVENNGRISVIIENKLLEENAVDKTSVWTIDCTSREWRPIAQDISSAEFTDNGKSVKLNQTEFRISDWEHPDDMKKLNTSLTIPLDFKSADYSSSDVDMINLAYEKIALPRNSTNVEKYFTSNGLKQLQEDYDYDCPDGDCYGTWCLTTGAQDDAYEGCPTNRVVGINPDNKGGYTVIYFESGYFGATHVKIKNGKIDHYKTVLSPTID